MVSVVWLQTGDMAALDEFEALFNGAKFYKGLEMSFTNTKDGSLALRIGDEEVRHLPSPCCSMRGLLKSNALLPLPSTGQFGYL